MNDVSNGQRALWMVLITSLAAPFFASLLYLAISSVGPIADFLLPAQAGEALGDVAIDAFIWSALPATVAGLGLSPFVLQHGSYGWLEAAVAGVLGFAAGAIIFPLAEGTSLPFLAFVAGLVAIGLRAMLTAAGILLASTKI